MQRSFLGGAIELKKMKTKRAHKVEEMRKAMDNMHDTEPDQRFEAGI